MSRNDVVKDAPRSRRRSEQLQFGGSWRHNSIALNSRGSLVIPEDIGAVRDSEEPEDVVPFYKLFTFATWLDIIMITIGLFMASLNGLCIPVGTILYGEFTALLIDRTVPGLNSTPTITLAWFGGGRIVNNGTEEDRKAALVEDSIAFGVGCAVLSLAQWIVGLLSVDLFNYSALRQIEKIREKFLRSVLRQDIAWYDTNKSVNFATKVSEDLEKFREGVGEKVAIFAYLLMSFITSVLISLVYGWELTLVILSCAPVIIGTTALVAKVQSSLTSQELKSYSIAGIVAEEVLGAIRTVVAFSGEEKEIKRYSDRLEPAKKTGRKKGIYSGVGSGIMWLIIYASYALAFWYGVKLILEDRGKEDPTYTPAVLMIVFFSVLAGAQNLGLTSPHLESFAAARASAASIYSIMQRKPPIDSLSEEGSRPNLKGDIILTDVHFKYPARPDVKILQGLDLTIPQGETVALVGPSGCGKSTVIQLIQRLYDPESGSVRLAGHDLRNVNVKHLRQHIAVVGQEPVLFAGSIKDNIRYGNPSADDEDIENAARAAYCHSFIKKLPDGYDTVIGERGSQLSGGQKQRIAIARALIRQPSLLLLDEATSALDSHSEAKVQKALDAASSGRTTVMVSHRLTTVLNVDKIVFIDKGQVVEIGNHKELMEAQGRYFQLVSDNEAAVSGAQPTDGAKPQKRKLKKLESIDSVLSVKSSSSSSSEEEEEEEEKKEPEYDVSTWRILKMNSPETVYIVVGILAAVTVGASFPAFAVLFGETYGVLASKDAEYVMKETEVIAILFMLVGVITGVAIFFQIYMFTYAGVNLTARLRVATFSCMLSQEMAWFDDPKNAIGALTGRLAGDAAAVQGATGSRIGALVQAGSTITIGICLSLFYTWRMTLVSLVSVPLVIVAVVLEGRILGNQDEIRKASDNATKLATEAISNIRTVASFCGEEGTVQRYADACGKGKNAARKRLRWRGSVFSLGQTAPFAGYALSLYYGGILVANKELNYKEVIKVSEALIFGAWMMGQALAFAPNFGSALAAAGRIFFMLDRKPAIVSTKTPAVSDNFRANGKILYKSISFSYPMRPEAQILDELTLEIPKGKKVALVGQSGCGKSTLIQLLQRLYDPVAGNVYLDDFNITTDMTLTTLRRQLGIVSQEPVLFDKTIYENIAYGDNSRSVGIEEVISAAKEANIHGFVASLPRGYDTSLGSKGAQLSGGQKQRIAIARALVRNPRVLLLDEATSALDAQSEKLVQEALDKASEGRTCIIIAHRLTTIQQADIICVIDKGVVVEKGTHRELMEKNGMYAKLYELQYGFLSSQDDDN